MSKFFLLTTFTTILLYSCNTSNRNSDKIENKDILTHENININSDTTVDSILIHFWDNFNFNNPQLATSSDYGEQHFANFINLFPQSKKVNISKGINSLLEKSAKHKSVLLYFEELFNKYLYDVNSPFYNEDYYIITLEQFINSDYIIQSNKIIYRIKLEIANKNRQGDLATNFTFYFNRKTYSLYDVYDDYVILFFYVPGCKACEHNIRMLKSNSEFKKYLSNKTTILALYTDGNKEIWENYAHNIPSNWINGIDLKQEILKKGLYDLKASPTIYLLDKHKRVLLKDTNLKDLLYYMENHIK